MDSPSGQDTVSKTARAESIPTRLRLLQAAAELIAEIGWGRVTTRSIAERAGLPHGTVSYHFHSKQALLTEAALHTVEQGFPKGELKAVETLADLIPLATTWAGDRHSTDPVLTAVLMEAMRESTRDPVLQKAIATTLRDYRQLVADLVQAEQHRDGAASGQAPSALATLFVAAGDGLWLHGLLDPGLDVAGAAEALLALLRQEGRGGRS